MFKNYIYIFSGTFGRNAFSFLILIILAKQLGPREFGVYTLLLSILGIFTILISWSQNSIIRFGKKERQEGKKLNRIFCAQLIIISFSYLVTLFIFVLFKDLIGNILRANLRDFLNIIVLYPLIASLVQVTFLILQIDEQFKKYSIYSFLNKVLNILIIIGLIMFEINANNALYALLVSDSIILMMTIYELRKEIFPLEINRGLIQSIVLFSYPMILGGLSSYLIQYIDNFSIQYFLGSYALGVYSLFYRIQDTIFLAIVVLSNLILPRIVDYFYNRRFEQIKYYYEHIAPVTFVLITYIMFIPIIFADRLLIIMGDEYVKGAHVFILLLMIMNVRVLEVFDSPIFTTYGFIKSVVSVVLVSGITNLFFDIILIPKLGINGAAIASLIAFLLSMLLRKYLLSKRTNLSGVNQIYFLVIFLIFGALIFIIDNLLSRIGLYILYVLVSLAVIRVTKFDISFLRPYVDTLNGKIKTNKIN